MSAVFQQLDAFEELNKFELNSSIPVLTAQGMKDILLQRFRRHVGRNPAIISNVFRKISKTYFDEGGWIPLKFEFDGSEYFVRMRDDEQLRHDDEVWSGFRLHINMFEETPICCRTGKQFEGHIPEFVVDLDELRALLARVDTEGFVESYPTYRASLFSAYHAFSFDEVFKSRDVQSNYQLQLKGEFQEQLSRHLVTSDHRLEIYEINDEVARVDYCYEFIIGGATVCFVDINTVPEHLLKTRRGSKRAVNPTVKPTEKSKNVELVSKPVTVQDELQLLTVVNESRLELPQVDLKHYKEIKRLLLEADGSYSKSGFNFSNGDAPEVLEALLGGKKIRKRRKEFAFFATRQEWAKKVCDAVRIEPGMRVAEFHAGHGAIADEVRRLGVNPYVNELWQENVDVLKSKGYSDVSMRDFLEMTPADTGGLVDCIVGNPPWGRLVDLDHFHHCLTFLKTGGSLSLLLSHSAWTSQTKKAIEFRALLERLNAQVIEVEEGAFDNTGVKGIHVIIDNFKQY